MMISTANTLLLAGAEAEAEDETGANNTGWEWMRDIM